jgi:FG-GAP-like repeat
MYGPVKKASWFRQRSIAKRRLASRKLLVEKCEERWLMASLPVTTIPAHESNVARNVPVIRVQLPSGIDESAASDPASYRVISDNGHLEVAYVQLNQKTSEVSLHMNQPLTHGDVEVALNSDALLVNGKKDLADQELILAKAGSHALTYMRNKFNGAVFDAEQTIADLNLPLGTIRIGNLTNLSSEGLDVVAKSLDGRHTAVMLSSGRGQFQDVQRTLTGGSDFDFELGDVNGDGYPDLINIDLQGKAIVDLNNGSGEFTGGHFEYLSSDRFRAIEMFDLDMDGKSEIWVQHQGYGIGVLDFDSENNLLTQSTFIPMNIDADMVIRDINDDGQVDIIGVSSVSRDLKIAYGMAGGGFASPTTIELGPTSGPNSIAVIDSLIVITDSSTNSLLIVDPLAGSIVQRIPIMQNIQTIHVDSSNIFVGTTNENSRGVTHQIRRLPNGSFENPKSIGGISFGTFGMGSLEIDAWTYVSRFTVNIRPKISLNNVSHITFEIGRRSIPLFPAAEIVDDSPFLKRITISNAHGTLDDRLQIIGDSRVSVNANRQILLDEVVIGSFSGGNKALVINLNSNATPEIATQILRAISFRSGSQAGLDRTIGVTVFDERLGSIATTVVVKVLPLNEAPTITGVPANVSYQPNSSVAVYANAGITDSSPTFGGGRLLIRSSNAQVGDRLMLVTNAVVTLDGNNVLVNNRSIGIVTGQGARASIAVAFNTLANRADVELVLRQFAFSSTSNSKLTRKLSCSVSDGALINGQSASYTTDLTF